MQGYLVLHPFTLVLYWVLYCMYINGMWHWLGTVGGAKGNIKKNTLFVFSDLDTNVALNNVTVNGLIIKVHFLD